MPSPEKQTAEQRFREAFARLKTGRTDLMPAGTPVTQNNVAKEAGCDPSALRKSRYPELINEIQAYVHAHQGEQAPSMRQEVLKRRRKNRSIRQAKLASDQQRDRLASQLLSANAMIVELTRKLADAQARLDSLMPTADRLPFARHKPRGVPS